MSSFTSAIVGQSPTVRSHARGLKPTVQKRSTLFHHVRPALCHRAAVSVRAAAAEVTQASAKPISGVPEGESAITHLECALEGDEYEAGVLHNLSKAGKPLLVRYDYEAASKTLTRAALAARPATLWKWREILPVTKTENCVYLGEEATPILDAPRAAGSLGVEQAGGMLYVKDEGRLPTGSFKARGLVMAVSMAKELGVTRMAMPTNGNAGAALAAYCRHCGIEAYAFAPEDTPATNISEMAIQGAKVWKVNGYIDDCGKIVGGGKEEMGWFDTSTLKEPYRIEGKKTMGLELAEQFGFDVLPDVILYPTGGGTGLIGMWKAFQELEELGIRPKGAKKPRMVAVQAEGCAPIVNAYKEGKEFATRVDNAYTRAAMGIRVPAAVGDFLIIRAVRESGGFAATVNDDEIDAAQVEFADKEGVLLCPEGAATYAAYKNGLADGSISPGETAVLFNCATGLKYPLPPSGETLDCTKPIDYNAIKNA